MSNIGKVLFSASLALALVMNAEPAAASTTFTSSTEPVMGISGKLTADKASYGSSETINFSAEGGSFSNISSSDFNGIIGFVLTNKTNSEQQFVPSMNTTVAEGASYKTLTSMSDNIIYTGVFGVEAAYYDPATKEVVLMQSLDGATNYTEITITENKYSLFITSPLEAACSASDQTVLVSADFKSTKDLSNIKIKAMVYCGASTLGYISVTESFKAGEEKTILFKKTFSNIAVGSTYTIKLTYQEVLPIGMYNKVVINGKNSFGDVNLDGSVDAQDMQQIRDFILIPSSTIASSLEADLTLDGAINVGDVIKLSSVLAQ